LRQIDVHDRLSGLTARKSHHQLLLPIAGCRVSWELSSYLMEQSRSARVLV
jgi:hypothetical protein